MDKLLISLGHDTSNCINSLKRSMKYIENNYFTEENKSNGDYRALWTAMADVLEKLQSTLDQYNIDRKIFLNDYKPTAEAILKQYEKR